MQLFAPAKINLSFEILRRREDGFHEIETLMVPISLGDELTIEPNESEQAFLFPRMIQLFRPREFGRACGAPFFCRDQEEPRVRITLRKKIPHGAGLGGGSSDAASTLLGLNELYNGRVAFARLTSLAAEIGSDVPFFLVRGAARCRGRGEIVEPVGSLPE